MKRTRDKEEWIVKCIGVFYDENKIRHEKKLEDITEEELKEIAYRKNREAMLAAGYIPANETIAM